MRRWNSLYLVPLLAVVLAAVVSLTPPGASAHSISSPSINFKGKIVAKNADTHYFVLSFTCSGGKLSAGWTYEVSSTTSFTGTVGKFTTTTCSFSSASGLVTNPSPLKLEGAPCGTCTPTLTLTLMNNVATKTFFNVFISTELCSSSASPQPCLDVETSGFSFPNPTPPPSMVTDFSSQQCVPSSPCPNSAGFPYATLTFSGG